jgi:isopenicillin N synthase-like dioxygenase
MLVLSCLGLAPVVEAGYAAFRELLQNSAMVFGDPETAVGADRPDAKRYLDLGSEERTDIPPAIWKLRQTLCRIVYDQLEELEASLLRGAGMPLATLLDQQRGPVLRLTWYPGGKIGPINHQHTDIDLFTVLPAASQPGLELKIGSGWKDVELGPSEVLVLPGELLQHFSGLPPVEHRVVANFNERISASLFVNADPTLSIGAHGRVADLFEARIAAVKRTRNHEGI